MFKNFFHGRKREMAFVEEAHSEIAVVISSNDDYVRVRSKGNSYSVPNTGRWVKGETLFIVKRDGIILSAEEIQSSCIAVYA